MTPQTLEYRDDGANSSILARKESEDDFSKVSPFLISKTLYGLIGETKSVRKVKDGLLVETSSNAQSKRLLEVRHFVDFQVNVVPHGTLDILKGVIYCTEFLNCSTDEICKGLKDKGVIGLSRIRTKRDGIFIDTPNHILTFNSFNLPSNIKAAYYNLNIPSSMRCFECQVFDHIAVRCNREQVCICGKTLHEGVPCGTHITCVNCERPHSAKSISCLKFKTELTIQKIKVTEKISYFEAKKKVIVLPQRQISLMPRQPSQKVLM
ncbi:hypothetical protein NQ314_016777 [Rhamnusium bicolor]|uniref:Uncharacterized protein n=1 Tax=Rhamnusium bicolor TaxID=1586634 RepID=A0AAV8WW16_9CUCU|nr:hypothetical protein NQ314_016777 [Rhamnusium bicolor]